MKLYSCNSWPTKFVRKELSKCTTGPFRPIAKKQLIGPRDAFSGHKLSPGKKQLAGRDETREREGGQVGVGSGARSEKPKWDLGGRAEQRGIHPSDLCIRGPSSSLLITLMEDPDA